MNFEELKTEIFDITNRPDLITETESAIKAATLKAHSSEFFDKDIFETGIQFDVKLFRQSIDYFTLLSNFRAIKYLRRVEDEFTEDGTFFRIISVDEILDAYGENRTDIAYVAGRVIEVRAKVEFDKALLGSYVFPIVRKEAYDSWVAIMFPFSIIYEAARRIFITIGQIEESNKYRELVGEEYIELKLSNTINVGF